MNDIQIRILENLDRRKPGGQDAFKFDNNMPIVLGITQVDFMYHRDFLLKAQFIAIQTNANTGQKEYAITTSGFNSINQ